jgi:hypothetical protein
MVVWSHAKGFSPSNGDGAERPQLFLAANEKAIFHANWQAARYNIYRSWRKGNNGQNEAAAIIVFNYSNQK